LVGGKIMAYLAFEKVVEVGYDPDNVVAVDINEDNVTAAVFVGGALEGVFQDRDRPRQDRYSLFREEEEDITGEINKR